MIPSDSKITITPSESSVFGETQIFSVVSPWDGNIVNSYIVKTKQRTQANDYVNVLLKVFA